jgi:hypothetical protein
MSDFTEKWMSAAAKEITKIINQVVAEEREACPKIAAELTGREGWRSGSCTAGWVNPHWVQKTPRGLTGCGTG